MSAFIRLHRGQYVDCYVPSAVGIAPSAAPTDRVWALVTDINPSKVIYITQNVQAFDPITGQLLFNSNGTPKWETTTVTNSDGTTTTQNVTQQVEQTVYLQSAPNYFVPGDFTGVSYTIVGSLAHAQMVQIQSLSAQMAAAMALGFASTATGPSTQFNFADADQSNINQQLNIQNAGIATWPINWPTKAGPYVSLTQTQFMQFVKDAAAFKWGLENKAQGLIQQVQASTTAQEVSAVVWS